MKKIISSVILIAIGISSAQAVRYDLFTGTGGFYDGGNPKADGLFEWDSGSITVNPEGYTFTQGTTELIGGPPPEPWFEIDFNGNPQPYLTKVVFKAGSGGWVWLEADLMGFNNGTWTSIRVHGDSTEFLNNPGNAYTALSHGGALGTPGEQVPDNGSTLILLSLGLGLLGFLKRRK